MNKNDYRRALIMLRSLRTGVSGYVRLERRTLIGTLHFTINGVQENSKLCAVLLYRQGGSWHGVRAGELAAPRYGQTGLVWKFDPRNIENRALEQYDLAAVIEIRSGICDLLLCGNLNGSVSVDWAEIREASCRVFTPVRIAGSPLAPIDEEEPPKDNPSADSPKPCTLPDRDTSSKPAYPGPDQEDTPQTEPPASVSVDIENDDFDMPAEASLPSSDGKIDSDDFDTPAETRSVPSGGVESDDIDTPPADMPLPVSDSFEADEIDTPALSFSEEPDHACEDYTIESDEIDTPAQEASPSIQTASDDDPEDDFPSAGDQLNLKDKTASWPGCIASLKPLFFESKAVVPFEAEGYVFIRAPLPEDSGTDSCFVGLYCEDGVPARVCYALPAKYSPEPPAGLEGYVWRGDSSSGCWAICEAVTPD